MVFWKDSFHCEPPVETKILIPSFRSASPPAEVSREKIVNPQFEQKLGTPSLAGASREQRGQVLICMAAPSGGDRSTPASTISPTTCHSYKLAPIHSYRGRRWGCKGKRASGTILSPWTSPYNCQLLASCFSKLAFADRDRCKPAFRWPEKLISLCACIYSKLQELYLGEKPVFVFSELSIIGNSVF